MSTVWKKLYSVCGLPPSASLLGLKQWGGVLTINNFDIANVLDSSFDNFSSTAVYTDAFRLYKRS